MAILTKKGTCNLFFPKGKKYSSISDADFNESYNGAVKLREITGNKAFDVVANWVCNAKEITVIDEYFDEDNVNIGDHPVTYALHKVKLESLDLADELPGVTLEFDLAYAAYNATDRLSPVVDFPNTPVRWGWGNDTEGGDYSVIVKQAVDFVYHRGKWYSKMFDESAQTIGPLTSIYRDHSLTRNAASFAVDFYDSNEELATTHVFTLTITDTYYD